MSYIDMFKHKELGTIAGIMLYQALEDIEGDEFRCEKDQLILGGGGGEHPGAVVNDINSAIHEYNRYYKDIDNFNIEYINSFNNLDFVNWTIKHMVNLHKEAILYGFNQDIDDNRSHLEVWLNCEIAKFVMDKYPELIKDL